MRLISIPALLLAGSGVCAAGDLNIHLMLAGEVAPGVYGQVQVGNESPPPIVYAQPMLIEPQAAPPPPVYLHVPPGHARNWRKHCREYNACNRPVYFVRSEEYESGYVRRDDDRDRSYDRDRDYGREHDHEHERGRSHHGDDERDDRDGHGEHGRRDDR